MKFGMREACEVVFKAKKDGQKINGHYYQKGQPVMYFDSLKMSTLELSSQSVYAQGGKGNNRIISWSGDKNVSFTIEDALFSPMSLSILTNGNLTKKKAIVHRVDQILCYSDNTLQLDKTPLKQYDIYYADLNLKEGQTYTPQEGIQEPEEDEPFVPDYLSVGGNVLLSIGEDTLLALNSERIPIPPSYDIKDDLMKRMHLLENYTVDEGNTGYIFVNEEEPVFVKGFTYKVDYYYETEQESDCIEIDLESSISNFYVEGETLIRDKSGKDHKFLLTIPNCRPQANINLALSATGDPSSCSFVLDAFPGYADYDLTTSVLASLQVVHDEDEETETANGLTQM